MNGPSHISPLATASIPATGLLRVVWRIWQYLTIPLFYGVFAVGCLALTALVPFNILFQRSPEARVHFLRKAAHHGARAWLRTLQALGLLDYRVIDHRWGSKSAADTRPQLIVANHPTLVDVIFVLANFPDLGCILKADLTRIPVLSTLVKHLNYLSNSDPEHLLKEGTERLLAGERLLIFAEGTRTDPGSEVAFRLGAAELALRARAMVLPLVIHCNGHYSHAYLSKACPWHRIPAERICYRLELGALLKADPDEPHGLNAPAHVSAGSGPSNAHLGYTRTKRARRRLTAQLQNYFRDHLQRLDGANHPAPVTFLNQPPLQRKIRAVGD